MARINLNANYHDRIEVKALGARWDAVKKTWYVDDDNQDLKLFEKWLPAGGVQLLI